MTSFRIISITGKNGLETSLFCTAIGSETSLVCTAGWLRDEFILFAGSALKGLSWSINEYGGMLRDNFILRWRRLRDKFTLFVGSALNALSEAEKSMAEVLFSGYCVWQKSMLVVIAKPVQCHEVLKDLSARVDFMCRLFVGVRAESRLISSEIRFTKSSGR